MCKFVSAIVTEDKIYFPLGGLGGDHKHTSILFNHKIRDDIYSNHVEIEILPIGKSLLSTNLKDWKMVIDTNDYSIPKWFNKKKQEVTEIDAIYKVINMVKNFDGIFKYDLYCPNCSNLTEINSKVGRDLKCYNCPNLTKLPDKVNRDLDCSNCSKLIEISGKVGRDLNCSNCPKLTKLPDKVNGDLNCSNCPNLTKLPDKVNGDLNCSNCPKLTEINNKVNGNLDCSNCPKLTKISGKVNGYLNCYNCSKLTIQKKQKEN